MLFRSNRIERPLKNTYAFTLSPSSKKPLACFSSVSCIPHPQAEIHIVEGHRKGFVQTAHFVRHAGLYQQAGTGEGGKVLHRCSAEHIAADARLAVFVAVARVAAKAGHNACMLQRLVRVKKLCAADGRAAGVGALPQQLREPIRICLLYTSRCRTC